MRPGGQTRGSGRRRRRCGLPGFSCLLPLIVMQNISEGSEQHIGYIGQLENIWANVDVDVTIEAVEENNFDDDFKEVELQNKFPATLVLGGNKSIHSIESFSGNSFCPKALPQLPSSRFAASGCYFPSSDSILVCGGRENILSLTSSCLLFTNDKQTWEEAWPLPAAVAGAATLCIGDKMLLIGGVIEEDYYQGEDSEGEYYYDYSTEVATVQAVEFDMQTKTWTDSISLQEPLQGACGVAFDEELFIIGGKNDKDCNYGSDQVLWRNIREDFWKQGPTMNQAKFHHGCAISEYQGNSGIVTAGGIGLHSFGESVEFLYIDHGKPANSWISLPKLTTSHPHAPTIGHLGMKMFVHGGVGDPYQDEEDKTEILVDGKWKPISGLGISRSFGLGISVPDSWTDDCRMKPNFGVHPYFKKIGQNQLNNYFWICNEDKLQIPFEPLNSSSRFLRNNGCTVPGCQFSRVPQNLIKAGNFSCQVRNTSLVECQISCKDGYTPLEGRTSNICTRDNQRWKNDFLECTQL